MAVLSAASMPVMNAYICCHSFWSLRRERNNLSFVHKFEITRSVNDTSSASSVKTESSEIEDGLVVEAPKGPPSLISSLNVQRALRGIPITDIDYYGKLGLQRGCSYDQVYVAYKNKMEELNNKGLDEEELRSNLAILKESYTVLSNPEERRLYDWSLVRTDKPGRYTWPFEADTTQKTPYDPPPQEPEDEGSTRAVGYFMLVWLVLGAALSIVLNR